MARRMTCAGRSVQTRIVSLLVVRAIFIVSIPSEACEQEENTKDRKTNDAPDGVFFPAHATPALIKLPVSAVKAPPDYQLSNASEGISFRMLHLIFSRREGISILSEYIDLIGKWLFKAVRKDKPVASKAGITPQIYKIDADAAIEVVGATADVKDLPAEIIGLCNKQKSEEIYAKQGRADADASKLMLYRNVKTLPSTSSWVSFFQASGIKLEDIQNQMQHLVCFVVVDDELYAYTAGQSAVRFERFIDIAFPIEVGRRVAKAES